MNRADGEKVLTQLLDDVAIIYITNYLNKLAGERIERECRRQLKAGCRVIILDFQQVAVVNSVGISILLGIISAARERGAELVFCAVGEQNLELFKMLGLTQHVGLTADTATALAIIKGSSQ